MYGRIKERGVLSVKIELVKELPPSGRAVAKKRNRVHAGCAEAIFIFRGSNMFGKLVSGILQTLPRIAAGSQCLAVGGPTQTASLIPVRTVMRNHWPRPSEYKRVKRSGWKTRMSTPNGRKMLMRAILKGKHILCH